MRVHTHTHIVMNMDTCRSIANQREREEVDKENKVGWVEGGVKVEVHTQTIIRGQ